MSLPQPDPDVLRKAQQGDRARRSPSIVRAYETPIHNYILRLTGDRTLAEDLTQEVFLRVFKGLPALLAALQVHDLALPGDEEPRARRAARARAPPARRRSASTTSRRSRATTSPPSAARRSTRSGGPSSELNPDLKMALLLRDIVGLPYTEIADVARDHALDRQVAHLQGARGSPALARPRGLSRFDEVRADARRDPRLSPIGPASQSPWARRRRERLGQAGRPDLRLRPLDRVGGAAEAGTAGGEVEQQPRRPRVAAARLADRARVEQPARGREVDLVAGVREAARERRRRRSRSSRATWLWPTRTSGAVGDLEARRARLPR